MKFISHFNQTGRLIFCSITLTFLIISGGYLDDLWCASDDVNGLRKEIDLLIRKHKPIGSQVGLGIFSITNNKSLYGKNVNRPFVVASNMKLFTTAAALVYLGQDFEFRTKVYYRGTISSNGELKGDIIVVGSGDPNLSGRFYNGNVTAVPALWSDKIKSLGIKKISGDVIADDRIFDREFVRGSWPQDQLSKWYCAQVGGLSFNDNCIDIVLRPNRTAGAPAHLAVEPDTSYVTIVNECKSTSDRSKHFYSLVREPLTNIIYIRGYVWSGENEERHWVTVHNPPLYTAAVLKDTLEAGGVSVMGVARVVGGSEVLLKDNFSKIMEMSSKLGPSVVVANKRSQNFYAEQILKTLGARVNKEGSFSSGLSVIKRFIARLGFSEDKYHVADGSGLSKENKLTPHIITRLLYFMYRHKCARIFLKSLPVSGIDGTLKNRLNKEPYKSRVKAKTGYVYGASALSGYVKSLDDEVIAFSIIVNGIKGSTRQAKRLQDAVCRLLVTY